LVRLCVGVAGSDCSRAVLGSGEAEGDESDQIEESVNFDELVRDGEEGPEEDDSDAPESGSEVDSNEDEEDGSSSGDDEAADLAPPNPGDALADTAGGRKVKVRASPRCRACGGAGHKWPTCKNKDVLYILARMHIIPEAPAVATIAAERQRPEVAAPPAPAARIVAMRVVQLVASLPDPVAVAIVGAARPVGSAQPLPPVAASAVGTAAIPESKRQKRGGAIFPRLSSLPPGVAAAEDSPCPQCNVGTVGGEGWRLTVTTCAGCGRNVHVGCATKGRNIICSLCKAGKTL